jgi:hypothetical protein
MRTLKLVLLAMVLGFASTPTPLAQGLPSDVDEKFGLRPNQPLPRHVRQDLLQEYRYHRRREAWRAVPGVATPHASGKPTERGYTATK